MEKWMNQGTTLCYNDVEKDIIYCHKYGFDAIELKYNMIKNYDMDTLKWQLKKNHVKVGALGAVSLPVYEDYDKKLQMEKKIEHMCQIAVAIECENIVVIPPYRKQECIWEDEDSEIISLLENYLKIAEEYGRKLAFEVLGFHNATVNTFQEGLKVIRTLASENIGLILDFYHFFSGNMDKGEIKKAKANEIFIVHVNDGKKNMYGKYLDDERLWPGEGEFAIEDLIQILKEMNYSGPISLETYRQEGWEFDMEECYKLGMLQLDQLLNSHTELSQ